MINDLPESNIDLVSPCFCLSKNDSYVVSASGKMVSLFNMLIFKVILKVVAALDACERLAKCSMFNSQGST